MAKLAGDDQPVAADECSPGSFDSLFAVCRQGDIGCTRVAAVERPLGLAVPDDEDARSHSEKGFS